RVAIAPRDVGVGDDQVRPPDDAGSAVANMHGGPAQIFRDDSEHYFSPIVIEMSLRFPPRTIEAGNVLPMFSEASRPCTSRVSFTGRLLRETKISPTTSPSFEAGMSFSTISTIIPAEPSSSGSGTGCKPTPRYPRATRPRFRRSLVTRSTVTLGMATGAMRERTDVAIPTASPRVFTTAAPE